MSKSYYSLGLMSGTSMDGVDASIIHSDGITKYEAISNKYFKYNKELYQDLTSIRDKITVSKDLKTLQNELKSIEKEITLFHVRAVDEIIKVSKVNIDFIGFHGQTIFHNPKEKISKQLGDGKLLSELTKKTVIYNFRQNDLKNGGEGAPLSPIFHKLLAMKFKIAPVTFLNLGGIANQTNIHTKNQTTLYDHYDDYDISAEDMGPGMCLIDRWIRINSKEKYDKNGKIGKAGKINKIVLEKALKNFKKKRIKKILFKINPSSNEGNVSYDTKDFDLDFVESLSLEDGVATLTEYTVRILFNHLVSSRFDLETSKIVLCGGGRKNKFLIDRFKNTTIPLKFIDDYGIDGDFVESQAFAYLAIRSYLNLSISFPETTGVREPCTGGIIIKNF